MKKRNVEGKSYELIKFKKYCFFANGLNKYLKCEI